MSLPSYGFAADGVEYNRAGAFYLASGGTGGQTVPADLTVKGNLEVQGATHLVGAVACDSTLTATVGTGQSVVLASAGGSPGLASTVYTNNSIVGAIGLDSVGAMVVGFGPSSRPVTIPGTLTVTGAGGGSQISGGLTLDVLGCPSITGGGSALPNFPLGLLIAGQPISTGITASTSAGGNNSWWVKFSPPGSLYSFALVGGSGAFSGGTNGGMTISGPPYTSVISAVGGSLKSINVLITHDSGGDVPSNGEIKFFCTDVSGTPSGTGTPVNGLALVLITN